MLPGSVRNWWAGLEALTLLFIKEHNYLCGELRKACPTCKQCEPVALCYRQSDSHATPGLGFQVEL